MTNCALYYYWHWQWPWQKFWYLHPSKFSTTNVDIVSSSSLHPSNPHTWWRGGRPPTDQWPPDPKPAPSQHLASGHPSHFHSFVLPSQVDPLSLCLRNAHPNVQFFTTYIDLCKSFIIIFSCRILIFNCKSLVHPDTHETDAMITSQYISVMLLVMSVRPGRYTKSLSDNMLTWQNWN